MLSPARPQAAATGPTSASKAASPRPGIWVLVTIIVVAAALRFVALGHQSYWLDESQAAHELRLSFGGMLSAWSRYEWNPPLYLIVAWPWAKLFGTGATGLRALSALLGIGLVPLVYACGAELVSRAAGLVAAALTAINPFMIAYSQEAREYMLLMVLCAASLLFFARTWRTGARGDLVAWTALSILALLTQYYAGFLLAAEGLALVYRLRSRDSVLALALLGLVVAALIPHVTPRLDHPVQFIVAFPLSLRLQQVPVAFALGTLYKSSLTSEGLIGAAVIAVAAVGLLIAGAGRRELRGAGLAALLAAAVLLVPLLLALAGHDDYIARGLMPAWIPLVIVLAAAATARGARLGGGVLALVLGGLFVYGQVRVSADAAFQKPDWRGVAAALGPRPPQARAIVAYDGVFATGPLSIYLPGVPWSGPGIKGSPRVARVSEIDVIGSPAQIVGRLPAGTRVLGSRPVDGYRVVRFALAHPLLATPAEIAARAPALLGPPSGVPIVMIQRPAGAAA